MKKICGGIANLINVMLVVALIFAASQISYSLEKQKIENKNVGYLGYSYVEEKEQEIKIEPTPVPTIAPTPVPTPVPVQEPTTIEGTALETVYGKLTGYGYDCYGCTSGRTAAGVDITGGKIYYNDAKYGSVRILSGGPEYPFGTIVRMSEYSYSNTPIIGIVLDRGGGVGAGRHTLFDLCYASEGAVPGTDAYVKFEILRYGY